jgi:deazaflavin-dependent oxidoreductase (nitroreductase family)
MAARHEPATAPPQRGKVRIPSFVPLFNAVARRLIRLGVPLGPNALLTVRGRRSGQPRTTPVALVEAEGRRWISSPYGEVQWVRNLRASGEATVAAGRRRETVRAVELDRAEAERFFADVLGPYVRRSRVARWLIGSVLGAPEIAGDPRRAAERHPVFELHPAQAA